MYCEPGFTRDRRLSPRSSLYFRIFPPFRARMRVQEIRSGSRDYTNPFSLIPNLTKRKGSRCIVNRALPGTKVCLLILPYMLPVIIDCSLRSCSQASGIKVTRSRFAFVMIFIATRGACSISGSSGSEIETKCYCSIT